MAGRFEDAELHGWIGPELPIGGDLLPDGALELEGILDDQVLNIPPYRGAYTFTPSEQAQTIEIAGKMATENITINPIPQTWGRITWNGAVLTVS